MLLWTGRKSVLHCSSINFSTFLGRAGLYLEDLFVMPEYRGKGYGKALLKKLASIAVERGCGRFEWVCLDWNKPSIDFLSFSWCRTTGRLDHLPHEWRYSDQICRMIRHVPSSEVHRRIIIRLQCEKHGAFRGIRIWAF